MEYRCLQDITMVFSPDVEETGDYLSFDYKKCSKFFRGEIYCNKDFPQIGHSDLFEAVPAMIAALTNSMKGAELAGESYSYGILDRFRKSIVDCSDENHLRVILKKKIAGLRNAMTILDTQSIEHGIVWCNAQIFEELEREVERCRD